MDDNFYAVPAHQQSIESTSSVKINLSVDGKRCMDDNLVLEAEIQELVAEGRASQLKQKLAINKLSRLLNDHQRFLAGKLAGSPCLDEAWSYTLTHCLVNFWTVPEDDNKTGSAYCDSPNIVYRIRNYFKHRIEDLEKRQRGYNADGEPLPISLDAPIGEDRSQTWGDMLPALEQNGGYDWVRTLIEEDITEELRATTMKSQPALNAQKAFLMSLAGYSKRDIAKHFEVSEQAFYSFFTRSCFPLLRRLCLDSL
jgi:hypothetical protein